VRSYGSILLLGEPRCTNSNSTSRKNTHESSLARKTNSILYGHGQSARSRPSGARSGTTLGLKLLRGSSPYVSKLNSPVPLPLLFLLIELLVKALQTNDVKIGRRCEFRNVPKTSLVFRSSP